MTDDHERTASLMTPAKLSQLKPKPAVSPAAWLDRMASDAGHAHVNRLGELREQLEAQAGQRDYAAAMAALRTLADRLPRLDFTLLQQNRGLLARFTGKGKHAGAEFTQQVEQIAQAADGVKAQGQALARKQQAEAAATERTLVEFEVEFRALEKIIDQGARWLQDMRNQLKARQASATEAEQPGIREDAARCELLLARLKVLRAASSAAQESHQLAQSTAARRAALLQALQNTLVGDVKLWQARMSPLVAAAADASSPALSLEGPHEIHNRLQQHVQQAAGECEQLQAQEAALAASLSGLGQQLAAAQA